MDENLVLFHKGWPSQWHMSDFEDEEGKVHPSFILLFRLEGTY